MIPELPPIDEPEVIVTGPPSSVRPDSESPP